MAKALRQHRGWYPRSKRLSSALEPAKEDAGDKSGSTDGGRGPPPQGLGAG